MRSRGAGVADRGGSAGRRILVGVALAVMPAFAADPAAGAPLTLQSADTVSLTLDDALAVARRSNPGYRQAAAALDLNGVETRATWAGEVLPRLDINLLRTGYGGTLTRRATDFFGNPIENPESDWVYNSSTSQGISLNWQIQGMNILNARRRQSHTNLNRELRLAEVGWALESRIRRLYFDALEQRELLVVEEGIQDSRRVDLESAQRLYELAQRSRVDVLTAELQVEQQALNIQQQSRSYQQAILTLRTALGDPELEFIRPEEENVPVFDPALLDEEDLVRRALGANPALEATRSALSGARLGVREARTDWFPTLSVNYSLGRLAQTRQGEAFLDLSPESDQLQSSFGLTLSIPALNNYFQTSAGVTRAQVELDQQQEALREERLQVEETVRTQLIALDNQYRTLALATRSLEIAGEALRLAREEYRIGTRTFEQLQETVTGEADARRQVIQARYGFVEALLTLEEAVGAPLAPLTAGAG